MPWIDGRHRLLAQGDRPKRRDDLVEIIAASVLHRLPQVRPDDAIEVAEIALNALRDNNLRIVWRPRRPPARPMQYVPPKGKNARLMRREARRAAGLAASDKPPLIVMSHGGPTSSSSMALKYSIQFWTSRGIAVLDVNYGGSSGYGRKYRDRLKGNWGIVDVDDCCNGALHLARQGRVDITEIVVVFGVFGHPLAGQGFQCVQWQTLPPLGINAAEKTPHIGLRGGEHDAIVTQGVSGLGVRSPQGS